MDSSWKFSRIRYNTPLEKSLRRTTYIPENKKLYDVKHILKKYLGNFESLNSPICSPGNLGILQSFPDKNVKDTPKTLKVNESKVNCNKFRPMCRTPNLNFSKGKGLNGKQRRNKSLVVKKMKLERNYSNESRQYKLKKENRLKESNYCSYADIYKCLVEQIPIK